MKLALILLFIPVMFGKLFSQKTEPTRITANGVELHYIEKGRGEPLVLLHGGVGDYRSWDLQIDEFSKNYRVISYSRRYHFPNKNTPHSKYKAAITEAEDLAALLRALKIERVHLVGHSYGGLIALIFAVKHPEAVRSLVLSEPPAHQLVRDLPGGETLYRDFMNAMKSVVEAFKQGNDRKAMGIFSAVLGRDLDKLPPPLIERTMQNALAIRAINESPEPFPKISKKKLRRLKIPTLIITGANTVGIHKLVDQELVRLIPDVKEYIVPNAGHISARDSPQIYNESVLNFLKNLAAK